MLGLQSAWLFMVVLQSIGFLVGLAVLLPGIGWGVTIRKGDDGKTKAKKEDEEKSGQDSGNVMAAIEQDSKPSTLFEGGAEHTAHTPSDVEKESKVG